MIHNHSDETNKAFHMIENALVGDTLDDLDHLIEELDSLLLKAKQIKEYVKIMNDGSDYEPISYCFIPERY